MKWNTFNRPDRDEKSKGFGIEAADAELGLPCPDGDSPETGSELLFSSAPDFSSDTKEKT